MLRLMALPVRRATAPVLPALGILQVHQLRAWTTSTRTGPLRAPSPELGGLATSAESGASPVQGVQELCVNGLRLEFGVEAGAPPVGQYAGIICRALPDLSGHAVLDVGCGCGVVGMFALLRGATRATFVDVVPSAAAATRANLRRNGLDEARTQCFTCSFDALPPPPSPYDLAIFNPPQMPEALLPPGFVFPGDEAAFRLGGPDGLRVVHAFMRWLAESRCSASALMTIASITANSSLAAYAAELGMAYTVVHRTPTPVRAPIAERVRALPAETLDAMEVVEVDGELREHVLVVRLDLHPAPASSA